MASADIAVVHIRLYRTMVHEYSRDTRRQRKHSDAHVTSCCERSLCRDIIAIVLKRVDNIKRNSLFCCFFDLNFFCALVLVVEEKMVRVLKRYHTAPAVCTNVELKDLFFDNSLKKLVLLQLKLWKADMDEIYAKLPRKEKVVSVLFVVTDLLMLCFLAYACVKHSNDWDELDTVGGASYGARSNHGFVNSMGIFLRVFETNKEPPFNDNLGIVAGIMELKLSAEYRILQWITATSLFKMACIQVSFGLKLLLAFFYFGCRASSLLPDEDEYIAEDSEE